MIGEGKRDAGCSTLQRAARGSDGGSRFSSASRFSCSGSRLSSLATESVVFASLWRAASIARGSSPTFSAISFPAASNAWKITCKVCLEDYVQGIGSPR
jgi:hypothetical protein